MVTLQCGPVRFESLRAVLFDKDGTLADIGGLLRELGDRRSAAVNAQVPGTGPALRQALGIRDDGVDWQGALAVASRFENEVSAATYVSAQGYGWSEALAIAQDAFAAVDRDLGPKAPLTPPFPEVRGCLERLAAAGLKLGIVSADAPKGVTEFVDFYGLRSLCPVALGSTQACLKPDPCLLQNACRQLGVEPQNVLIVGDASSDVALARRGKSAGVVILRRDPALQSHDFGADAYGQTLGALQVVDGTASTPC